MAKRVLFIGNFDGHRRHERSYNTDHKLRNGFIRAGHQVVAIDERAIDATRIARDMLDVVFERPPAEDYGWPTAPLV